MGMFARKNRAIRTITEPDNRTSILLADYPDGKVVIKRAFNGENLEPRAHNIRSWDVRNLLPASDPRETAQGTGSIRAYGVNMKGRVSGRVFRTNGMADDIGALACLRKHPVDDSRRAPRSSPSRDGLDTSTVKASPC
jgi:hypothetical protein